MIVREYRAAFTFFRQHLRLMAAAALLFILGTLAAAAALWIACERNPSLLASLLQQMGTFFDAKDLSGPDGQIAASRLFLSNCYAAALAFLLGILPLLFLPVWPLLLNAALLGAVAAAALRTGMPPAALAAALLPHGIFELPALILSDGLGLVLCRSMTRRLLGKTEPLPFWALAHELSRLFVLGVVPLLAVAALIESYFTGWLTGFFL